MKIMLSLAAAAALSAGHAAAQSAPSGSSFRDLPPPGLNDPGVRTQPAKANAQQPPTRAMPATPTPTQLPGKPIPLPQGPGDSSSRDMPDVRVVQEKDRTIQQYRRNGRVYMIVETPKHGIPHTYMVGDNGQMLDSQGHPPVHPVMYKVVEWGTPKSAADEPAPANPPAAREAGTTH